MVGETLCPVRSCPDALSVSLYGGDGDYLMPAPVLSSCGRTRHAGCGLNGSPSIATAMHAGAYCPYRCLLGGWFWFIHSML
mgnify:CR=1 FL=1